MQQEREVAHVELEEFLVISHVMMIFFLFLFFHDHHWGHSRGWPEREESRNRRKICQFQIKTCAIFLIKLIETRITD